jgi:hypothetical protein
MGRTADRAKGFRGVFMTLAVLALAFKILTPPGYMIAGPGASSPLVICTGHGAAILKTDPGAPSAPMPKKSDQPCAFAGNVTPLAPSTVVTRVPVLTLARRAENPAQRQDLLPGRGLAAPPPPSQGPPTRFL